MEQQPGHSSTSLPSAPIEAGVGAGAAESALSTGNSKASGGIGLGTVVGRGKARGMAWPGAGVGNGCDWKVTVAESTISGNEGGGSRRMMV